MLGLLLGLQAPAGAHPAPALHRLPRTVCSLVETALTDLQLHAPVGLPDAKGTYPRDGLVRECPSLRRRLPSIVALVTEQEAKRLSPSGNSDPITISYLQEPVLSADGQTATINFGYSCTGLCGTTWTVSYKRERKGWVRTSEPHVYAVS